MRTDLSHTAMANNFLASKKRTPHYEITYITDCCPMEGWHSLESFTEEEMDKIRALRDKYGKEEFFKHLDEVFDEDSLYEICPGEIIDFDIDTIYYTYNFTCHQVTPKGILPKTVKLHLTDETYLALLQEHLKDKDMNFNRLRYANKELHEIVRHGVDSCFLDDGFYEAFYPYAVTMDEIKADAEKIKIAHPEHFADKFSIKCYGFVG